MARNSRRLFVTTLAGLCAFGATSQHLRPTPRVVEASAVTRTDLLAASLGFVEPDRTPAVTRSVGARHQSVGDHGWQLRLAQQKRAFIREKLHWDTLPEHDKTRLWDLAVGDDQINGRGELQVSLGWLYEQSGNVNEAIVNDLELNVDGDVVLAGTVTEANPLRFKIIEIQGSNIGAQGWTENWLNNSMYGNGPDDGVTCEAAAVDLRGNTYVAGTRPGDGRYAIWKLDGADGSRAWRKSPVIGSGSNIARDIEVDIEELVYVAGSDSGLRQGFISKHDPVSGDVIWSQLYDTGFLGTTTSSVTLGVEVGPRGDVYFAQTIFIPESPDILGAERDGVVVHRIDPYTGAIETTLEFRDVEHEVATGRAETFKFGPDGFLYIGMELDPCEPFVSQCNEQGIKIVKIDPETGEVVWTIVERGFGYVLNDLEIDRDGNVFALAPADNLNSQLRAYGPNGMFRWNYTITDPNDFGRGNELALDRLGTPYISGRSGIPGDSCVQFDAISVRKIDPADGSLAWQTNTQLSECGGMQVRDMLVDGGGQVYVSGEFDGGRFVVLKLEQPYLEIPQLAVNTVQVRAENRSIWVEGEGSFDLIDQEVFNQNISGNRVDQINDALGARARFTGGSVRGALRFKKGDSNPDNSDGLQDLGVSMDVKAGLSGGTLDATVEGELTILAPSEDVINPGDLIDLQIDWTPDFDKTAITANANPEVTFQVLGATSGRLDADFEVTFEDNITGSSTTLVSESLFNQSIAVANVPFFDLEDYVLPGPQPGASDPGAWISLVATGPFSGKVRRPDLTTQGSYDANTNRIVSNVSDQKFIDTRFRVTEAILLTQPQLPPLFYGVPLTFGGVSKGSVGLGADQLVVDTKGFISQELSMKARPYLTLEFSTDGDMAPDTVTIQLTDPSGQPRPMPITLPVRMPVFSGDATQTELEIKPTFGATATFDNTTSVRFENDADWRSLEGTAVFSADLRSVGFGKYNIINEDNCWDCFDIVNDTLSASIVRSDIPVTFPKEDKLSKIKVFGANTTQPALVGASREVARMLIYDQRDPNLTQAEFNAYAAGTSPFILYGFNFTEGNNFRVRIDYHGRTETIDEAIVLNDQAVLVDLPNRFLLLPGTIRMWVKSSTGTSETIEIPVEYPFPNFLGLEEVYWASDPRWKTEPVIALDGGTPAGNDSFLTRRDYYTNLRDNLWNPAVLTGVNNTDQGADEYFDDFPGWDPDVPPAFPTLLMNGAQMSREGLDMTDGEFRASAPEALTASGSNAAFTLIAPGPGGGESRSFNNYLPQARPVVSELSPPTMTPYEGDPSDFVRLVVRGPTTVPIFDGFEPERFGNFTPNSVVEFNSRPIETEFIDSGELIAWVPASELATPGRAFVFVATLPQGDFVNSITGQREPDGGASAPINFDIAWPEPALTLISHDLLELNTPPEVPLDVDGVQPSDDHNITLAGENFTPGCRVYIGGRLASSTRDSSTIVRATLEAGDVSRLGRVPVYVENPGPNPGSSTVMTIEVVLPESGSLLLRR